MLVLKYRYLFDRYIIKREYIGEYKGRREMVFTKARHV